MLETTILSNLILNEDYSRKVFPYIKEDYFEETCVKKVFSTYAQYVEKYKESPSLEALKISLDKRKDLNEQAYKDVMETVEKLKLDENTNNDWLVEETEKFCQDRDLYNSIRRSILILDGQDKEFDKGSIPKLLSDSLGISFDSSVGHDFLEDYEDRFDFYHQREERIPFDVDLLNKITKGGLPNKSLTVALAETGAGKTLFMCHNAAAQLLFGKNVLYITLEMAEERIAERIDANILDVTVDELKELSRDVYRKKMDRIKGKTTGKLVIKEYPTGSANSGHIRYLIKELQFKKNFEPDIVYIDYLNLCSSARIKGAAAANSYTLVKSIAEELRGLAMEFNIPIVSATQANRSAYGNSDIDLTNTSESIGLPATVDAMFALITSEDLESRNQLMIKQLKNRWGDLSYYRRFVVGIDRSRMKLYNLEDSAQSDVQNEAGSYKDDRPTFDKTQFGMSVNDKRKKLFETEGDLL